MTADQKGIYSTDDQTLYIPIDVLFLKQSNHALNDDLLLCVGVLGFGRRAIVMAFNLHDVDRHSALDRWVENNLPANTKVREASMIIMMATFAVIGKGGHGLLMK